MRYIYTAKNAEGALYTREEDARDKLELYARVKTDGGTIVKVREKASFKLPAIALDSVTTRDKIILAKNLSSMLSAGLPLPRALSVMQKETSKISLRKLLESLSASVDRGEALSQALERESKTFPALFTSMVRAGEESGDLSGSLKVASSEMEKTYQLVRRIRGAMIYPIIVIVLMIVIATLLLIYMVPTLTATFKGLNIELPLSTRVIIGASDFLASHTILSLSTLTAAILLAGAFFKSPVGGRAMDRLLIRLPFFGQMVKEIGSARTARTLSSLLSAGVPVGNALEVTSGVQQNHLYKGALLSARQAVEKGETLSAVFSRYSNLYPPFVPEMAAVGEETGRLSEMLGEVARYYEEDIDEKTKDLSSVIEPLLMLFVGIAVGIFAISMLAPTYSLVETIQ